MTFIIINFLRFSNEQKNILVIIMDIKIAQYLNKDTSNVMEKCLEKLYDSLEQDICLICNLLNKERNDIEKCEEFLHNRTTSGTEKDRTKPSTTKSLKSALPTGAKPSQNEVRQTTDISILLSEIVNKKDKTFVDNSCTENQATSNNESKYCNIINKSHTDKILNRIKLVIKIITNLNVLEQEGTSYLGSG